MFTPLELESIESREIGNLSTQNSQTNEGEDDLRDDISNLSSEYTLRNTAEEGYYTQTEVGSLTQERQHSYNSIDQRQQT